MHDIGKNIRDLRTRKNLTQDELAEKLFVTRQTVSNYETGKSRPDIEMLLRISEVLEADIQLLLYGPIPSPQRKQGWIRFFWSAVFSLILFIAGTQLRTVGQELFSVQGYSLMMIARLLFIPGGYFMAGWSLLQLLGIYTPLRPLPPPKSIRLRRVILILLVLILLTVLPFSLYLLWTIADYWVAQWQGVVHYSHQSSFPMLHLQMLIVEAVMDHGVAFSLFGALLWLCGFPGKSRKDFTSHK